MKPFRFLLDRWPFFLLILVTTVVLLWAGRTLQTLFTPQVSPPQVDTALTTGKPSPLLFGSVKASPSPLASAPLPNLSGTPGTPAQRTPTAKPSPAVAVPPPATAHTNPLAQNRYGHLPYNDEISPDRLVSVGTYGSGADQRTERLDQDAARAFFNLQDAAKAEGISLVPISGYRSVADQDQLFRRQIQRQGSAEAAARLSAPPGYSEHHTGFALDIGDRSRPDTDLKFQFDQTPAYRWLLANASTYGFELSFPPNNIQGVSFEPWHWRFTASSRAAATFAVAHTLRNPPADAETSP